LNLSNQVFEYGLIGLLVLSFFLLFCYLVYREKVFNDDFYDSLKTEFQEYNLVLVESILFVFTSCIFLFIKKNFWNVK